MNSFELKSMISHRLRKLSQSGLAPQELALKMQQLLEEDRKQKLSPLEPQDDFAVPLFGRQRTYLAVV